MRKQVMERLSNTKTFQQREQSLILKGFDAVSAHGFTQIPNVILRRQDLSVGAKLTYACLLSYGWQKDKCFPGQDTLAQDLGVSKRSIVSFLKELEQVGYVEKIRRGLGKTNVYILHCTVKR
jgi:hypothetical protein